MINLASFEEDNNINIGDRVIVSDKKGSDSIFLNRAGTVQDFIRMGEFNGLVVLIDGENFATIFGYNQVKKI